MAIKKFTTFLGLTVNLSCFKKLPLNSLFIFELLIHLSFGDRILLATSRGLIFSFDNPLDSHSAIVSVIPVGIVNDL